MPREHRKRGKRKKHNGEAEAERENPEDTMQVDKEVTEDLPSWIEPVEQEQAFNPDAPFGFCDPDVKAYFRTVEKQLKEWQDLGFVEGQNDAVEDPNLERRMFFAAALSEMQGKELQLATDPDCAVILERMVYSMDDLARRIFAGSLMGSFVQLAEHRFGSHVLETLLEVGAETVDRETRGTFPAAQSLPQFAEQPTFSDMIAHLCTDITPYTTSFVNKPFASHVLQRLLVLLVPDLAFVQEKGELRSKRSAGYKSKAGPMKSVFDASSPKLQDIKVPKTFKMLAKGILEEMQRRFSPSEVRALAADKVACPTLRIIVALETILAKADAPASLTDHLLVGMIAHFHQNPPTLPEESDYIGTLLRDATASHLLQTIFQHVPEKILFQLWDIYLKGNLGRLSVHPVANFVVSEAIRRLDTTRLVAAVNESAKVISKCIKQQRIGPVTALVNRAATLQVSERSIVEAICGAVEVKMDSPKPLIPQLLGWGHPLGDKMDETSIPRHTSVQGALLLQAILRLPAPHNEVVTQSFEQLQPEVRLSVAHDSTSSRVIDAIFDSPTVSRKAKKGTILSFIGQYQNLVDDRIGSRVGDRCWANADPFLKEKIARSLFAHQQFLIASYYGKFFAKKLQLALLQRKPEEWKAAQARQETSYASVTGENSTKGPGSAGKEKGTVDEEPKKAKKRKREEPKDEIDALFEGVKENRFSKVESKLFRASEDDVGDLGKILGAIKAAPKGESKRKK